MKGSSHRSDLKIIAVIPARMASERLPGKVLLPIAGVPMVQRVFEGARNCRYLSELLVATDSEDVYQYCTGHQIPVLMTAAAHRSGTERIHEVMQKKTADIFVNIQGDEPMLNVTHVDLLVEPFLRDPKTQVTTLKTAISAEEAQNPNVVKVVTNADGTALYFSRAPIPYHRNSAMPLAFYKHLGFYAYRAEVLDRYCSWPPSQLEQTERLEQMRFLEHGIPIHVSETPLDTIGVDTNEDWQAVTRHFEGSSGKL